MFPPIFSICAADATVKSLLGVTPTRLYPFGKAPENVTRPYAVWQQITGTPENFIGDVPDIDSYTVQVDVYSLDEATARQVAQALRNAIEPSAHIVAWRGESIDPETGDSRISFDVDFWVNR